MLSVRVSDEAIRDLVAQVKKACSTVAMAESAASSDFELSRAIHLAETRPGGVCAGSGALFILNNGIESVSGASRALIGGVR